MSKNKISFFFFKFSITKAEYFNPQRRSCLSLQRAHSLALHLTDRTLDYSRACQFGQTEQRDVPDNSTCQSQLAAKSISLVTRLCFWCSQWLILSCYRVSDAMEQRSCPRKKHPALKKKKKKGTDTLTVVWLSTGLRTFFANCWSGWTRVWWVCFNPDLQYFTCKVANDSTCLAPQLPVTKFSEFRWSVLLVWLWDQRQVSDNWLQWGSSSVPGEWCSQDSAWCGKDFLLSGLLSYTGATVVLTRKESNSKLNSFPIRHTTALHTPELWVQCFAVCKCLLGFPWSWRGKLGTWLRKRLWDM